MAHRWGTAGGTPGAGALSLRRRRQPLEDPLLRGLVRVCALVLSLAAAPCWAADVGAWQATLDRHLRPSGVDYARIAAERPLDGFLAGLATTSAPAGRAEALAFWVNAYNALTVDLVADHWPLASLRDLDGGRPWSTRRFRVAGRDLTLDEIEHQILRPLGDPRVHAALNCASRGCAPLPAQALRAETVDAQLDAAARAWVGSGAARLDPASRTLVLSQVFDWFAGDFARGPTAPIPGLQPREAALVGWVARYSTPAGAAALRAGGYRVVFAPYDWSVNAAR